MSRGASNAKTSWSRTVGYRLLAARDHEPSINETECDRILERAKAKGIVKLFDTGRGRIVWFDGAPGPAMRQLVSDLNAEITVQRSKMGLVTRASYSVSWADLSAGREWK